MKLLHCFECICLLSRVGGEGIVCELPSTRKCVMATLGIVDTTPFGFL